MTVEQLKRVLNRLGLYLSFDIYFEDKLIRDYKIDEINKRIVLTKESFDG